MAHCSVGFVCRLKTLRRARRSEAKGRPTNRSELLVLRSFGIQHDPFPLVVHIITQREAKRPLMLSNNDYMARCKGADAMMACDCDQRMPRPTVPISVIAPELSRPHGLHVTILTNPEVPIRRTQKGSRLAGIDR